MKKVYMAIAVVLLLFLMPSMSYATLPYAIYNYFYKIPEKLNQERQKQGLPLLIGDYKLDYPKVIAECNENVKTSCSIKDSLHKGCVQECKNHNPQTNYDSPALTDLQNTLCSIQFCDGPQSMPRNDNPLIDLLPPSNTSPQRSDNHDETYRKKICYLDCDKSELNCRKVNHLFDIRGGSAECAADRRSCDARCR